MSRRPAPGKPVTLWLGIGILSGLLLLAALVAYFVAGPGAGPFIALGGLGVAAAGVGVAMGRR